MTLSTLSETDFSSIQQRRRHLSELRQQVAQKNQAGGSGIEISNWLSDQLDEMLVAMLQVSLQAANVPTDADFAMIAVGGNGRRRPAPYSDVDLLLVAATAAMPVMQPVFSTFVRDCWDTGFQLGHSIRTPDDVVRFARDAENIQFATSLIDMRLLAGRESSFQQLNQLVRKQVFRNSVDDFVRVCVQSRREEWLARGDSVNQLEPDVKKSPGGLRDLNLIRWVTFAQFGDSHPSSLLEHNAVRTQELAILNQADEYLTSLRLDLHCRAGLKQDVLTRDLQLEIARSKGQDSEDPRQAVESFMQEYFSFTSQVARISRRVTEPIKRPGLMTRLRNLFVASRSPEGFEIREGVLFASETFRQSLEKNPEHVMQIFVAAAEYNAVPEPGLRREIGRTVARLPVEPSREACSAFRKVLRSGAALPGTVRSMFETRVLDWLIPPMAEVRCLMQFNQYHSYTVDEHTLKTLDEVVALAADDSPVGTAYGSLRHKATLHLSLLLHDIAKGRDGDHSILGEAIAEEIGVRLQVAEHKKRMMMFLVRQHLIMPDLAFRRDITDQSLLVDFARLVGSPELLRMLYVLSVADIKAVGPGVWTDWKGELLADLYNRTMLILSGRPINHLERERLQVVRDHVRTSMAPATETALRERSAQQNEPTPWNEWIDRQLDALPPFYLMTETPERISQDLNCIRQLNDSDVSIQGTYDAETDTVTYRVFATPEFEAGSFHKISGVLSGLRMDIHTAQSCTTSGGILIGSFLVSDNDFVGQVAEHRIREVSQALRDVLTGARTVDHIFRRSGLFQRRKKRKVLTTVAPRVCIDNDCSESYTVIDVFAMDTPGLLYTLAETLYRNRLSVELTRIATNIDQVVDVFYVLDENGKKISNDQRLEVLQNELMHALHELEQDEAKS
ncbi:MAG: [protein-PII] uridylyltransferase [Planctomycetaceae bacterium]